MAATPLMAGISLGGAVPQGVPSPRTLMTAARHAEECGYDALWCGDHVMMYSPIVEAVTLLSAFAGVTERVKLGTGVYLLPLRHPVVAAKLFAGLDYVSNGRLIFGVGVGGEFPKEFEACGVPVSERGRRTDEGLEIVQRLWTESGVTFEGRHYRFRDVTLAPRPIQLPHPPIWLGGRSDAALRRTARFGDGWLAYMATPQRIRESMDIIREQAERQGREQAERQGREQAERQGREQAERQGRDPASIAAGLLLFVHLASDRETARRRIVADLTARYNQPFEPLVDRYCAFGTAADCAATIGRFLEVGVTNLVLKFTCTPAEQLDHQAAFAEGVLPLIRST